MSRSRSRSHRQRFWHCRYNSLAPLGSLLNLRRLKIATYPDPSFDLLTQLRLLEELHIIHMPMIRELSPLAALKSLRLLTLGDAPELGFIGQGHRGPVALSSRGSSQPGGAWALAWSLLVG
jgi:hypothetical protein